MLKYFLFGLALLAVVPQLATAELRYRLELVQDDTGVSEDAAFWVADRIEQIWSKNFNFSISLKRFESVTNSYRGPLVLKHFYNNSLYQHWLIRLNKNQLIAKDSITLSILPPLVGEKHRYCAGQASVRTFGYQSSLATVYCSSDLNGCALMAIHEILHTMGASHINNTPNLMAASISGFESPEPSLLSTTKTQVRRHLKRAGLWHKVAR